MITGKQVRYTGEAAILATVFLSMWFTLRLSVKHRICYAKTPRRDYIRVRFPSTSAECSPGFAAQMGGRFPIGIRLLIRGNLRYKRGLHVNRRHISLTQRIEPSKSLSFALSFEIVSFSENSMSSMAAIRSGKSLTIFLKRSIIIHLSEGEAGLFFLKAHLPL